MNISASKFSSGCESGWTVYLDQSYASESEFRREQQTSDGIDLVKEEQEEQEEEEDLSMVSDASSGPPHCHGDDREDCLSSASDWASYKSAKNKYKETKNKKNKRIVKSKSDHHSCLDDTASSPLSKDKSTLSRKEGYSQGGFSATHYKGGSAFDKHFGMLESSLPQGSTSQKPGEFQGGNWK